MTLEDGRMKSTFFVLFYNRKKPADNLSSQPGLMLIFCCHPLYQRSFLTREKSVRLRTGYKENETITFDTFNSYLNFVCKPSCYCFYVIHTI